MAGTYQPHHILINYNTGTSGTTTFIVYMIHSTYTLSGLESIQIKTENNSPTFFPRVVNKTNISFSKEELGLLNKRLKYNLEHKHKHWINNLALEAENAITLLPPGQQEYTRFQVAKNIEKLLTKQNQHNGRNSKKGTEELRIKNQIKGKLQENNAMVTKADKGSSVVIIYCEEYERKINSLISSNGAIETKPTDVNNKCCCA